jgi:hypothetical protein
MNRATAIRYSLRAFIAGIASAVVVVALAPLGFFHWLWWHSKEAHGDSVVWWWFLYGPAVMVPLLTLVPVAITVFFCASILASYKGGWNPAVGYLRAGLSLALLGFLLSLLLACALMIIADWPD